MQTKILILPVRLVYLHIFYGQILHSDAILDRINPAQVLIRFYLALKMSQSGWPDWVIFCQLGYFWRLIMMFWKDEVAQNNGNFFGNFLFKQIHYFFKSKWAVSKHGLL